MPDPIIIPTIRDSPFRNVNVLCLSRDSPPIAFCIALEVIGAPIAAYPFEVAETGKRFDVKSKAEDMLNVRP